MIFIQIIIFCLLENSPASLTYSQWKISILWNHCWECLVASCHIAVSSPSKEAKSISFRSFLTNYMCLSLCTSLIKCWWLLVRQIPVKKSGKWWEYYLSSCDFPSIPIRRIQKYNRAVFVFFSHLRLPVIFI